MLNKKKYSLYSIAFIFAFIFASSFYFDLWKKNRITLDAPSYYTYLPATFIYNDLHLNFIDKDPAYFKDKIWYYKIEDGNKLIKHPMGISVALSPFFFIGHIAAKILGGVQDGYSMSYQNALSLGVLLYLFLGLFYLRKLLLQFFSEVVTAITLLAIVLGTNLFWYSTFEGLMPHAISFSFWCMSMYAFFQWIKTEQTKYLYAFALAFGMIVLIRPLSVLGISYFLIYAFLSKGGLKLFASFLRSKLKPVLISACIVFLISFLQLCYWKYATGHWLYDVYRDEHFIFDSPQIFPFLFSFRKGVFVYTPILIFAVIGLINMFRSNKSIFYGTLITLCISIYILSSWWAWSYGICWGMRPMIDYYSILSIPLAVGFKIGLESKNLKFPLLIFTFLLLTLNLFQTWQYKNGLIHYDDMTREAYSKGFFQTKTSVEWQDLLKPYDWDRRMKGLPQVDYSKSYFEESYTKYNVNLRGFNLKYVAVNPKAQFAVAAYAKEISSLGAFVLHLLKDGNIAITGANGKYFSVSAQNNNVILALATEVGPNEKFEITYLKEGDNRIALRSVGNGKYIAESAMFPNLLFASSNEISQKETFRLFVNENSQITTTGE